jgi:adenosylcobinamide-GDP ribazoletransferase
VRGPAGPGAGARRWAALFGTAVRLLTRIPVPAPTGATADPERELADLRASAAFFPAVGAVVAGAGIAVRAATGPLLGSAPATVLAVAAMVLLTGAFHEDGLADSADGLFGGWTPEQRLSIMRDSRIGTYGAVALLLAFALRFSLLAPLGTLDFARAVLAGHVLGRAAAVGMAATLPPVAGPGLGASVIGRPAEGTTAVVAVTALVAAAATAGWWLFVPLATAGAAAATVRSVARARVGGLTGDLLGAITVLAELGAVAAIVGLE